MWIELSTNKGFKFDSIMENSDALKNRFKTYWGHSWNNMTLMKLTWTAFR